MARAPKPAWLNDNTWVCRRHLPSARIPHSVNSCWYVHCPSSRPSMETRPASPARVPVAKTPPPQKKQPVGHPDANVRCETCGLGLRRRPYEIRRNKTGVFFCGRECQLKYQRS